eukprot:3251408-Prymnesium_polylepis.1
MEAAGHSADLGGRGGACGGHRGARVMKPPTPETARRRRSARQRAGARRRLLGRWTSVLSTSRPPRPCPTARARSPRW